ncbi:MAG: monovalent cation/H(+) antiporter subunit G [Methanoregula sp.]|nr:monovalent cation/H(+) antiporter subunit G [Methanoregula sp.]
MSLLVVDLIIWILLIAGAGFGLISLIGLLLFPDIRSRMYTAIRASLIGIGATGTAVFIYGLNALQTTGGNQYFTLLLHTVLLVVIVAIANYIVSSTILKKAQPINCNPVPEKNPLKTGDKE